MNLAWAKDHDIPLGRVTPHHPFLTDEKLGTYDGHYQVNRRCQTGAPGTAPC